MPVPAAAGFVAAIVYMSSEPVLSVLWSVVWLVAVTLVALLMVSTWRYPSFKQINVSKPRSPLVVLIVGAAALLIWLWSRPVLLILATTYTLSGILLRVGGIVRRRKRSRPAAHLPEHQIG
jgi:CDP-diacylglycerol--serine O-phosphatidyltransferase